VTLMFYEGFLTFVVNDDGKCGGELTTKHLLQREITTSIPVFKVKILRKCH
jgi:hypothetical protein